MKLAAILGRYEAWRGGAAYTSITSLHATGRLKTGGLEGTIEVWSTDSGKARQDVHLGPVRQQTVVAGDHGWANNLNGQVDKLSSSEAVDAAHDGELLFDGILHGRSRGGLALQPRSRSNGEEADVLRLSFGGNTYDYLLSHGGRLQAIRATLNGHTTLTSFDDWRMIGGARFPFVERVAGDVPSDASETVFADVQLNPLLTADVFDEPHSRKPALFSAGLTSSGWLPFEFFGGTRIFLPAEINGIATTVMLDSGASSTVVDRAYAESLGLKPEGEMTAQGAGGTSTLSVLNEITLKVGALSLLKQTMVAIDLAAIQRHLGHPLPIILGNEIFHDAIVDIDFQQHRISFRDPAHFAVPEDAHAVATSMQNSVHVLEVSVEGRPATLVFDLGNASPLNLFPRFWQRDDFLAHRASSTTLTGGLGGSHIQQIAMVKSLDVGGSLFTAIPTVLEGNQTEAARSGRLDGNLGMSVVSRFHLIVDFPHDRILFAPPVEAARAFPINHSGLTLEPAAGGLKVLHVAPNSPADRAGVKADDLIASANGADVSQASGSDSWMGSWRFGPIGAICELGLSNGRKAHLVLATYF